MRRRSGGRRGSDITEAAGAGFPAGGARRDVGAVWRVVIVDLTVGEALGCSREQDMHKLRLRKGAGGWATRQIRVRGQRTIGFQRFGAGR